MIRTARLSAAGLFLVGMATTTLTAGCANQPYTSPEQQAQNACQAFGPKTLSGAAIGALGGAAGGAGLGAAAGGGRGAAIGAGIGALVGLVGGLAVGHSLDQRDCAEAQQALAQMRHAPVGQAAYWTDPQTGSRGSYTAVSDEYPVANNGFCRRVRQDTTLHGSAPTTQVVVTCRTADGNYTTVQEPTA
jgi:surface antigen